MPDPDPQPPQPRGMSVGRWLLLLLPSVPLLVSPLIAGAWSRAYDVHGEATLGPELGALLITFAISAVLSVVLGVQMERWNRGTVQSLPRVIVYVLNILFTSCFVAYAGWVVMRKFSAP